MMKLSAAAALLSSLHGCYASPSLLRASQEGEQREPQMVPDGSKQQELQAFPEGSTSSEMDPEEVGLVAKELHISFDDADLLIQQQEDFAKVVDLLQEDVDFLHAEMPSVPHGEYIIMYKNGNIPPSRLEAIESFKAKHRNASVKQVASKRSLKEAEERVRRLSEKLGEGGYVQATFSIHGDDVKIVTKLSEEENEKVVEGGRVLKRRAADIFGLASDHDDLEGLGMFVVKHDEEDIVENYSAPGTFGGEYLVNGSSWPTYCTTGFTVERISDGKRGVATAGHCARRDAMCHEAEPWVGMDPFYYDPSSKNHEAFCKKTHIGEYGDMMWLKTPGVLDNPEFYVSSTKKKPVTSVAQTMAAGKWVCGYSRVNDNKKCKTITSAQVSVVNYDIKDGSNRAYGLGMHVDRLVSVCGNHPGSFMSEGDSGGPWWAGNTAYGITSGVMSTSNPEDSKCLLFTKAKLFPQGLGVRVLTA